MVLDVLKAGRRAGQTSSPGVVWMKLLERRQLPLIGCFLDLLHLNSRCSRARVPWVDCQRCSVYPSSRAIPRLRLPHRSPSRRLSGVGFRWRDSLANPPSAVRRQSRGTSTSTCASLIRSAQELLSSYDGENTSLLKFAGYSNAVVFADRVICSTSSHW